MFPKPAVPLGPVTVKDTVILELFWFDVEIMTLDIWEQVMFPHIERSTVAPPLIVAVTYVPDEVGVGDGVDDGVGADVGIGVEVGAGVGVAVGDGDDVEVRVDVGEGVDVGFGVGAIVTVNEAIGELVPSETVKV